MKYKEKILNHTYPLSKVFLGNGHEGIIRGVYFINSGIFKDFLSHHGQTLKLIGHHHHPPPELGDSPFKFRWLFKYVIYIKIIFSTSLIFRMGEFIKRNEIWNTHPMKIINLLFQTKQHYYDNQWLKAEIGWIRQVSIIH